MLKTLKHGATLGLALGFAFAGSMSASASDTLYDALGGEAVLIEIVDQLFVYNLADERIAHTFENSNIDRLKPILVQHLCALADGPCTYEGQDMRRVHTGLDLKTRHFNAMVENMQKAMRDADIPFSTQNRLLSILAPMHGDVVDIPYPAPR